MSVLKPIPKDLLRRIKNTGTIYFEIHGSGGFDDGCVEIESCVGGRLGDLEEEIIDLVAYGFDCEPDRGFVVEVDLDKMTVSTRAWEMQPVYEDTVEEDLKQ